MLWGDAALTSLGTAYSALEDAAESVKQRLYILLVAAPPNRKTINTQRDAGNVGYSRNSNTPENTGGKQGRDRDQYASLL